MGLLQCPGIMSSSSLAIKETMKSFNGRLLKSFIWIVGVGFLTVVMFSVHELVVKQRVKLRMVAPLLNSVHHRILPNIHNVSLTQQILYKNATKAIPVAIPTAIHSDKLPSANHPPEIQDPVLTKHIGFLKVHKAASTTTQAIFLRFGWRRKLTFILPPEYNKFGYPNIISINESVTKYNTLPPPAGKQFDILCHHVVYGEQEWDTFLPSDSKLVGTVREPFRLFISTLNYFNPRPVAAAQMKDPNDPVGAFLKNQRSFETNNLRYSFTNNRLAFEYGVTPEIIQNRDFKAFNEYLHDVLDTRFAVVMVAELYDESLVMVRRKLNWELNDILYAIKNVRSFAKADRYVTKEEHKPLHREAAIFDYLLYEFFEAKLKRQMREEGPNFVEEVNNFKEVRKYVEDYCHSAPRHIGGILVQKTQWNEAFQITREDCDIMHKPEIQFTQMIRKEQYGSATWNGPGKKPLIITNNRPKRAVPNT